MVASDWTMQRLADILNRPVNRPQVLETTALGAAWLAGMNVGLWPEEAGFAEVWKLGRCFEPDMPDDTRQQLIAGWHDAVRRTLT
jgi:glycerol kinase